MAGLGGHGRGDVARKGCRRGSAGSPAAHRTGLEGQGALPVDSRRAVGACFPARSKVWGHFGASRVREQQVTAGLVPRTPPVSGPP